MIIFDKDGLIIAYLIWKGSYNTMALTYVIIVIIAYLKLVICMD